MIKNLLNPLIIILLMLGQGICYAQLSQNNKDEIVTRFDDFKRANTTLLKIHSESEEVYSGFLSTSSKYTFKAHFYKPKPTENYIICSFSLIIEGIYEPLDQEVYVNINDSIYPLKVVNITKHSVTDIDESTTGIGDEKKVTGIVTNNYIIYNGTILIPAEVYTQIEPSCKFALRLYLDYETATFQFRNSEIKLFHQFIQAM